MLTTVFTSKGTNGLLAILKEIENRFKLHRDSDKEKGFFNVEVKIKGVKEPLRVRIDCRVIQERFVQFIGYEVVYSGVRLGETRMDALREELRDILYSDNTLFLQTHDQGDAYVYGNHAVANHWEKEFTKPRFYLVKKIKFVQLELLLKDRVKASRYGYDSNFIDRSIYYFDGNLYIRKVTNELVEHEDKFNQGDIEAAFHYLYDAVDENGHFYQTIPVKDPNNIRILRTSYEDIPRLSALDDLDQTGVTLMEFMSNHPERNLTPPFELPLGIDGVTIYSERVIGESLPIIDEGSWVYLEGDQNTASLYGKVISQNGKTLEVLWENDYRISYGNTVDYHHVQVVPDPTITLEKPKLVSYKYQSHGEDLEVGYGWLLSYTPNYARVVPIQSSEFTLRSILRKFGGYDSRWDKENEYKEKIEKHYGRSDFILLPVTTVSFPNVGLYPLIHNYLLEKHEDTQSETLKQLLIILRVAKQNIDFYLIRMLELLSFMPFDELVLQLTASIAGATDYYSWELRKDFKEKHLGSWIQFRRVNEGSLKANDLFKDVETGVPFDVLQVLEKVEGYETYRNEINDAERDMGSIIGVIEKVDQDILGFSFVTHARIDLTHILEGSIPQETPTERMYYWIYRTLNSYVSVMYGHKNSQINQ